MGTSRARVAFLVYLSASQHFLDAARAAHDDLGTTSGPEAEASPSTLVAGVPTSSALAAPLSTAAPVPQPSIPNHQAKKLWKGLKAVVKKNSKCPVPDGRSTVEVCEWFACKYNHHKTKFELRKKMMEEEYARQSPLKTLLTKQQERTETDYLLEREETTVEDYMLSTIKTRQMYYKVLKYALLQYDRGCDTEEMFDNLRAWTKTIFPGRYECIFKVVDEYLSTHEHCDERFTRSFEEDMFQHCKNKDFYKKDLPPTTNEPAGLQVTQPNSKTKKFKWTAAARGATGIVASSMVLLSGIGVVEFLVKMLGLTTIGGVMGAWTIMFGFFALAAGVLAASIALLVCNYLPKKKRAGVRASEAVGEDAFSSLK